MKKYTIALRIYRWQRGFGMDNKEFKEIFQSCMDKADFQCYRGTYYYQAETVMVAVNIQKSTYNNSYYINFGFWVKAIHDDFKYPKVHDCDIVGRFINYNSEMDFRLEGLDTNKLIQCLNSNMNNKILPVICDGVHRYIEIYPQAIMAAKSNLKKYLENVKV